MPTRGEAFTYLTDHGAEIFGTSVGSMLYVGHRGDTAPWWHAKFAPLIGCTRIAVIDIDKGNLETARHVTSELYFGDIRQTDAPRGFGLVFWDEGPEHLPKEQALEVCRWMQETNDHVLVSCPWGFMPQGSDPNHPEFHHWGPEAEDFQNLGWQVRLFGVKHPEGHGNLIAWI